MVKGAEDFAREKSYNIFLSDTEGKVELEKEHIDAAINRMGDISYYSSSSHVRNGN